MLLFWGITVAHHIMRHRVQSVNDFRRHTRSVILYSEDTDSQVPHRIIIIPGSFIASFFPSIFPKHGDIDGTSVCIVVDAVLNQIRDCPANQIFIHRNRTIRNLRRGLPFYRLFSADVNFYKINGDLSCNSDGIFPRPVKGLHVIFKP